MNVTHVICVSTVLASACTVQSAPNYGGSPAGAPAAGAPAGAPCADPGDRDFSDLYDSATPLAPASSTRGCIFPRDKDMFVVNAPAGAATLVQYSLLGDTQMAPRVTIFDAQRKRLVYDSGRRQQEVAGWVLVAPGTSVFLQVDQIHSDDDAYTLNLTASPLTEVGEPNNGYETATPVTDSVQGFLARAANEELVDDWFKVEVTARGQLSVDVDMSQGIAPRIRIFDANRKRVAYKSGGRGERIVASAEVMPGTYYIQLDSVHTINSGDKGELPQMVSRPYVLTVQQ